MIEGWGSAHTEALLVGLVVGVASIVVPWRLRERTDPAALSAVFVAVGLVFLDLASAMVLVGTLVVIVASKLDHSWWVAGLGVALISVSLPGFVPDRIELLVPMVALLVCASVVFASKAVSPEAILAMTAASALGVFVAVPDTEQIVLVAAAVTVMAAAVWWGFVVIEDSVTIALPLVFIVWAGGSGSRGRPAAFAGVTAALGLLWILAWWPSWTRRGALVGLLVVHAALVLVASRGAGILDSERNAWLIASGVLAVTALVAVAGRASFRGTMA